MINYFRKTRFGLFIIFFILLCTLSVFAEDGKTLIMATTTSTDNTGLLDYLIPQFNNTTGIALKWTATGTGKALKLGENCDVDILMVHAPPAEAKFIEERFGTDRREIMYNDFVIIGPPDDPADIKGKSISEALQLVKTKQKTFVSRGDNSGTHKKERALWQESGQPIPDKESWYVQTGQGMLTTINITSERNGYTMTDRGTYIKYENNLNGNPHLIILVAGDALLLNQYSVIAVNPDHCPNARYLLAKQFIKWITGPEAQQHIKNFKLLGKPLFTPNAIQSEN